MEIEYLNPSNAAEWDEFAAASSSAWFRHTTAWQKYSSCCRFDSNTRNFSFMVRQNGELQAIVPLLAEYSYPERDFDCFAMYGDYTPMPAYADGGQVKKQAVTEVIVEQLKKIALENGVRYGKFIIDPLIAYPYFSDFSPFNLMEEGASVNFTTTNIVDLRPDLDSILRVMRKGHKSAIKQVAKEPGYRVDIFDSSNITMDKILRFKQIHKLDAGRQTRTDASWECMYEWVRDSNACLVMLWIDSLGDYGAAALIMFCKKAAYYASYGTVDSGFLNGHGGYIIQWEAIKWLKEHGIEFYETGDNHFDADGGAQDFKLHEIGKYKKGFRGAEIPKITFRKEFFP